VQEAVLSTPEKMAAQRWDYVEFLEWRDKEAGKIMPAHRAAYEIKARIRKLRISAARRGTSIDGRDDFDAYVAEHGRGAKTGPLK
jgi:hypothetical protein